MSHSLEVYKENRDTLLGTITDALTNDERFVAAWLTGSYARGEADAVSDIDLTVVVGDAFGESLCRRGAMVTARPVTERLLFFSQFGDPANVHENNNNAPEGGAFTSVLYQPSAHIVDWILVPYSKARRPGAARVLFEHLRVPVAPPPVPLDSATLVEKVPEMIAYFWMMLAVVSKYLVRREWGLARCRLNELNTLALDVERLLAGQPDEYRGRLNHQLPPTATAEELATVVVSLSRKMEEQMIDAGRMGIVLRPAPMESINTLLLLSESRKHSRVRFRLLRVRPWN